MVPKQSSQVEVFDRDGNLVARGGKAVARRERRRLPSLLNPLNWLLLLAAGITAVAIVLHALSELAMRRAREMGYEDEEDDKEN
jgi:hypothetical protein